ncbi:uncharacterized protein LOC111401049 [Olea europaea var. sylvestris]|uniref:uncharacterized protein LOC111401049 n=1 Tax=Olea europaea var. sylvestris TaxID=158386 RepID=UPI000C1D2657|nr:uncharacterized protein LOC111401049 [Olea europaea var. sylvestris]
MNDRLEKTASSLAIVEKKPQKLGGCVGIFFKLFDWNRRFAKKKLFSKKLLPPVRLKQASKKFGVDENQAKLRLIADENSGGFPSSRKKSGVVNIDPEQKHEMRAPGLVARLMGLESMPPLQTENSKKVPLSGNVNDKAEKIEDKSCGYVSKEVNVEKVGSKNELRPQKLQKTGLCERLPVARLGAEGLQFKNVLSRSRKYHPKLTSPVKSPINLSGKNASRLIGAATRILEPGLARSRSKRALAYSNTSHNSSKGDTVLGESTVLLTSQVDGSKYFVTQQPKVQSSCRTCGHLLDKLDSEPSVDDQPMVFTSQFSHHVEPSCRRSERSRPGIPTFNEVLEECPLLTAGSTMENFQPRGKFSSNRNPLSGETRWHLGTQQHKPKKDMRLPDGFSYKTQSQNQMLRARNRVPPRSKYNGLSSNKASASNDIDETKDFVFPHRSFSSRTKLGFSTRADNGKFEMERRAGYAQNDSILPVQKRRPINITRESASPGFSSSFNKQKYTGDHVMNRKEIECSVQCINRQSKNRLDCLQDQSTVGIRMVDSNVVSYTVNSVSQKTGVHAGVATRRVQNDSSHESTSQKSALNENIENSRYKKPFPLCGDALGALLAQKLQELNLQGEDELGINSPPKTTAIILQELISALTSERPFHLDNSAATSHGKSDSHHCNSMSNSKTLDNSQAKAKISKLLVDCPPDSEHLSPGSVLGASFSNETCLSSSMDNSSGYKMLSETLDCSYDDPLFLGHDTDLLDSATSGKVAKNSREDIIDIHNNISEVLCCIELANGGLKESTLNHAKKVLLKAELVSGNATLPRSVSRQSFSIKYLFLNQLETLASVLQMNLDCFLNIEDGKEMNQLRRFTFDSVIEYLDSRLGQFAKSGFKLSTKMPFCVNTEMLIFDIVEEVRRWGESSGLINDELIEKEMSDSLGKWAAFDIEKFKIGIQIGMHIFQILVDEIVVELWNCKPNSSLIAQGFN